MKEVNLENIKKAKELIDRYIRRTPVVSSIYHSTMHQAKIALKLENLNVTGSFKIRGAFNAVANCTSEQLKNGVVAASAGNHAQGVAYACREFNAPASIYMPEGTPIVKTMRTRAMGAEIVLEGETYDDAYAAAKAREQRDNLHMIHPFADLDVINGQGTMGLEILEQVPDVGMIIVPIGGGGMISGIGCAIKALNPKIKVVGVQTESYPAMKETFYGANDVKTKRKPTIADGIAVKSVSAMNVELIKKYVDKIVTVSEDEIAQGIMELMEYNRVLAEGAAATSIAALQYLETELQEVERNGLQTVCMICGGNIDVNLLSKIATRGLYYSGRLMRLKIAIKDRPGGLAELLSMIAQSGANILQVQHERTFGTKHFQDVEVNLELEVTGKDHQEKVKDILSDADYYHLVDA